MGGNNANLLQDIRVSKNKLTLTSQTVTQAHATFNTQSTELLALIEQLESKFKELEEREAAVEKRGNEVRDKIQLVQERERKCVDREQKVGVREQSVSEKEAKWIDTEKRMQQNADKFSSYVQLSISGQKFTMEKETILKFKGSLFEQAIVSDHPPVTPTGEIFFARDPFYFRNVLHFMLDGTIQTPSSVKKREAIEKEFQYYHIPFNFDTAPLDLIDDGKFGVKLKEWLHGKKFQQIYKASINGYGAADFHKWCDNKGPTLTVIRSTNGYQFGGYTSAQWDSTSNANKKCTESFIFTLINPHNIPPTKYTCHSPEHAIYSNASYGPGFGGGADILCYNNSHQNNNSYTNFPYSYTDTTGKGKETFTGAYNFTVQEIEVFSVL